MGRRIGWTAFFVGALAALYFVYQYNVAYFKHYPRARVAVAERKSLAETITAFGEVVTDNSQDVVAPAGGRVVEVLAKEGDAVEAGQVVVAFDAAPRRYDLQQAEAALLNAQADFDRWNNFAKSQEHLEAQTRLEQDRLAERQAADRLAAQQRLFQLGAVPKAELDAAQAQYEAARQRLAVSQKAFDTLTQVTQPAEKVRATRALEAARLRLEIARRDVEAVQVRAPLSGVITLMNAAAGAVAGAGSVLFTVADLNRTAVEAAIPADQIGRVSVGQTVTLRSRAGSEEEITGKVTQVAPVALVQGGARVVRVRIEPDEEALPWKPGAPVQIEIAATERELAITIPVEALREETPQAAANPEFWLTGYRAGKAQTYVFVVQEDRTGLTPEEVTEAVRDNIYVARKVPVEVGISTAREVEIKSGLQQFDKVVVWSDRPLADYDRVIVLLRAPGWWQ